MLNKIKSISKKLARAVLGLIFLLNPALAMAQKYAEENFADESMAGLWAWLANILLGIVNFLANYLILPLMRFIDRIISYNNFLDSHAVTIGWPMVRDVSNMFFVVFLLIIAFSTILNISSYQYKNTLAKFI